LFEAPLLLVCHRPCGHRIPSPVWKADHHAEQVSSRWCLTEDLVDRILATRSSTKNQGLSKADLLDLGRSYPMLGNMLNAVIGPYELTDLHCE